MILKKCKKFDTFKKIIGDRIYDVNLLNYNPKIKDLEGLDIQKLQLSSDYLLKIDKYDPSFYNKCIKSSESNINRIESGNEIAEYDPIILKMREIENVNDGKSIFYISDIHLDYKLLKMFPDVATEHEVRIYIKSLIDDLYNETDGNNELILIAGDVSFNFDKHDLHFYFKKDTNYTTPNKLEEKEINKEMGVVFGQKTQLWWDIPLIETFKILKVIFFTGTIVNKKNPFI